MSLADILAAKRAAISKPPEPKAQQLPHNNPANSAIVTTATGINNSLTVHKSQGASWTEVFSRVAPTNAEIASMQTILAKFSLQSNQQKKFIEAVDVQNNIKAIAEAEALEKKAKADANADFIARKLSSIPLTVGDANALAKEATKQYKSLSLPERLALRKENERIAAENLALAEDAYDVPADQVTAEEHREIITQVTPIKGETFSLSVALNERQLMASELARAGKSFCFIGAAGTGKTTTMRSVAETLVNEGNLHTTTFKPQGATERVSAPSIAFVAYTRRAAGNLRKAIHKSPDLAETLAHNVMTIHALLEYEPVTFDNDTFRFEPKRHAGNPLEITHLVIEEASQVGLDLWIELFSALPLGVQIIFIGDLNQLPPVFGPSILNYALVQLPVIELLEVYRNAGIPLQNAHSILRGEGVIEGESYDEEGNYTGSVKLIQGKAGVQVGQEKMALAMGTMFKRLYNTKDVRGNREYDPEDCMILSPWNKQALGTDNLNCWVAQFLGEERGAIVHEVIAGFNRLYLAEGDRVMYNKQDGVILEIMHNGLYHGKQPKLPGTDLTRFGDRIIGKGQGDIAALDDDGEMVLAGYENFSLQELEDQQTERKMQCSHSVTVQMDNGMVHKLTAVGDFSPQTFSLGYALTVHKAQGSEWRKVFVILHKAHAVSLFRELVYTACTRVQQDLVIVAKEDTIMRAIKNPRIKGDTLAEKLEFFNSGVMDNGEIFCTKG